MSSSLPLLPPLHRLVALLAFACVLGRMPVSAQEVEADAYRIEIRGALDSAVQSHLTRAIKLAEGAGARLVLDLDTPGGGVEVTWQMARSLQEASKRGVQTTAWVNERATSAGAMLSMACDLLFMRPTGTIGSALPVLVGPTGMQPLSEDPEIKEKENSYVREAFEVIANESGRNALLAEAMVDPDVEIVLLEIDGVRTLVSGRDYNEMRDAGEVPRYLRTISPSGKLLNVGGEEALELGLADGLVSSLDELAGRIGVAPSRMQLVERTRSEDWAGVLNMWTPLLLILGFVLAYIELKIPGFGVAGVLSIVCFALVLFGRYLVGLADVPHVILMVVGVTLIAAELFLAPGTVWLGLVGVLSLLAGVIWSLAGIGTGFEYGLDREILMNESLRVMGAATIALVAMWTLSRFLPKTPVFNRLVLAPSDEDGTAFVLPGASGARGELARVGTRGRTTTALRPVGKVVLAGDEDLDFEARSTGPEIAAGVDVVVVEVQAAGRLVVEPVAQAEKPS